jgi:hypothetical protein
MENKLGWHQHTVLQIYAAFPKTDRIIGLNCYSYETWYSQTAYYTDP